MDSTQKIVLNKLDMLDKIYRKIELLEKKQDRMGLTEEEEDILKETRLDYYFKYDDMVEDIASYLVRNLMTVKAKAALKSIQKVIPWKGGMILTELEYHEILSKGSVLEDSDLDHLEEQLRILHSEVFDSFEAFADTEEGQIYCTEMAKVISSGSDQNVLRVVDYLDARYREFGDLFGLELDHLEVVFEE